MPSEAQLVALSAISTPTVVNVINLLGAPAERSGFTDTRIRAMVRPARPVVGFAATASWSSAAPIKDAPPRFGTDILIERSADVPAPRLIVVEDLAPQPGSAIFGEVLSNAFRHCGYVGMITNGAGRDLAQLEAMKWPCWSGGVAAGFCAGSGFLACSHPVTIAGLTIQPGDLLHADVDGVVRIPLDIVALVCELGPRFDAIEQRCINRLKDTEASGGSLANAFDELRSAFAKLHSDIADGDIRNTREIGEP